MRHVLLRLLGVAFFTWLEFVVFPGHTYLQAETQLAVPMLERLENPGFLSRDLVATHPDLEFTAYDETTLFVSEVTGISLRRALLAQQIACRAAGVLGVVLLALSTGMSESLALLIAACVNLGATLAGPQVMIVGLESSPGALAWGLTLLTAGLIAREKPLIAGLAGGLALIYDPALAAPLWLMLIVALIIDRRLRHMLRPAITVLAVFVLLLANLAQLQPGIAEQRNFFEKISPVYAALQQFRTPYQWVSLWARDALWSYLAVWVCGIWATVRIWSLLNRQARWFFVVLPACGTLSIFVSYALLDRIRWSMIPHIQPARWLLFTLAFSEVACWIAGLRASQNRRIREAALWFLVAFAVPFRAEVLGLLRLVDLASLERLCIALLLACVMALVLTRTVNGRMRPVALTIALLSMGFLYVLRARSRSDSRRPAVVEMADWVKLNTWGSSMFLFPDLGRSNDPGVFRASSERPVWVDWNSGDLVPFFPSFAAIWWDRWQQTMQPVYSPQRLQAELSLPVDYFVLTPGNRLAGVRPVFANQEFVVYDANDLRNAPEPLRPAHSN